MALLDFLSEEKPTSRPPASLKTRRAFLRTAGGAAAGATLVVAGCDSAGGLSDNDDPVASFDYAASTDDPLSVTFDASASEDLDGGIMNYSWDFGNGSTASGTEEEAATVTATYTAPGIYTVVLTVADGSGNLSKETQQIVVGTVDQGEGDVPLDFRNDAGVLNYAYALEQLEAAFYARVMEEGTFSGSEADVIAEIAAHEDIHRLTLQAALGSAAIRDLTPNFDSVNFGSPSAVLETAQMLEALGVAAYNGAAELISDPVFLAAAGSIVSVEARHAAAVRDLSDPMDHFFSGEFPIDGDFAIDDAGLYEARGPREILEEAARYVEEDFDVQGL